jgi:hypothetical protein
MARKVDVGSVLSRTFNTYGAQFTLLIPAALAVFLPVAIISGLAFAAAPVLGALFFGILSAAGVFLFQGMVIEAAADLLDGRRDQTIGSLIGGAVPFILPLLAAGLLVGLLSVLGLVLLIVGAFLVLAVFAVTAPAIVIERLGPIQGMKRSIELVKDQFLPTLGVMVVVWLILAVASTVLQLIFGAIDDGGFGYALGNLITHVLLAPVTALAASILYFDLSGYPATRGAEPAAAPPPTAAV